MKKLMMLSAAVLALQAIPAIAQEKGADHGKHRGEKFFEMQDTDKDGVISEAEFVAKAKERFTSMDADKDGKVTKEEAAAHHEAKKAKWKEKHGDKIKGKEGAVITPAPDAVAPVTE